MTTFEKNFQELTNGTYCIWDRIVIRGYIGTLQRENTLVYFLKDICGVETITPNVLKSFTQNFVTSVNEFADTHNIPILTAPKKGKHDFAQSYFNKFDQEEGVFLILKSFETANTFVSYQPKRKTKDPTYRKISRGQKQVNYYYFYFKDRDWGFSCIRICSYLPFNVMIYLNGHNLLEQLLKKNQIGFDKIDNCFIELGDCKKAQSLCRKANISRIQSFGDRWLSRLVTVFTEEQKRQMGLSYRYSINQIEYSHNIIFNEDVALEHLFERLTDQNRRIGRPDTISMIFDKRITSLQWQITNHY